MSLLRLSSLALALAFVLVACSDGKNPSAAEEGGDRSASDTDDDSASDTDDDSASDTDDDSVSVAVDAGRRDGSLDARLPTGDADVGTAPRTDSAVPAADARVVDGSAPPAFPAVSALDQKGPFATKSAAGDAEGPNCTVHRPRELGKGGVRHPVIIWGMGTGGFNSYQQAFDLWASHGFVVAAALLGNGQGDGTEMLACLDYVCSQYATNLDCTRVAASGHSQGGAGAIMTGRDPRVIATAPIQPYTQQGFGGFDRASIRAQTGPMLLFSGTNDTIARPPDNQQPVFDMINTPVMWANLVGADHVLTGIDGVASYREVALGWFRVQLLRDDTFRSMFYGPACSLCKDTTWMVQRRGID